MSQPARIPTIQQDQVMRAGRFVQQPTGYRAFVPVPLPPDPPLAFDAELTRLLSDADRALGRLDGVASTLPNPDLFVAMYVRHEAVLSSQIEGTQSTLQDVLEFEVDGKAHSDVKDVEEVVNYVAAMNHGLARLPELPLSMRLLREIHAKLMKGVRGAERQPGEFRTSQTWIGPGGCSLKDAEFVPPPVEEMRTALGDLEKFLHDQSDIPILVRCALAHAQFETIHPFLDGNGRIGRLLITLLLCELEILQQPLLYLSYYLKRNRAEHYDRLTAIRQKGDWEGWIKFFLKGVFQVSQAATKTARDILALRETQRLNIGNLPSRAHGLRLLDQLFLAPITTVRGAEAFLGCSYVTASNLIGDLERLGILKETTGQQRHRKYRFQPYLELFDQHAEPLDPNPSVRPPAST